jgi:hypothetical protein
LQSLIDLSKLPNPLRPLYSLWTRKGQNALINSAPDYSFQAITCGDAIDSSNVTTIEVFKELTNVAQEIAPKCEFLF